jgi:purine nucleosidase/pyrimidine-specific ribonucleoside hydrolase
MTKTPILYDCDPGHDDAIALVMAHRSSSIELLGVTTTCGNASVDKTTSNAIRVLDFIGAWDVPVAAGCVRPLARPLVLGTADGPSGLEGSPYLPPPSRGPVAQHAVDFLAEKLAAQPEPITIVATGPLCNIGLLVLKHPQVLGKIRELIWMGGVFYRKSEIITPTEFNAFCDPEAVRIVLDSGVPITMVGLDVTMQVLVEEPQYAELASIDTNLGRVVMDWLRFYEKLHRNSMGVGGAMHDPLALALAINPTLVRTRPVHIGVDLSGTYAFGATVADFWHERGEPDNARIAYEVDADRFFKLMFDLLRDAAEWGAKPTVVPQAATLSSTVKVMKNQNISG